MQPCPRQGAEAVLPSQREHKSQWLEDKTCSYCGSLQPTRLFELLKDGAELIPTDKNYKVYVRSTNLYQKFYFQHFSKAEQEKFVNLLNSQRVKIGFPGHFYRLPFFITKISK